MPDARDTASPAHSSPVSTRARKRASAAEQRERRRRIVSWGLSIVLGALLVNAVVGDGGYLATVRAAHEAAELTAEVTVLRLENQHLLAQGRRLQDDPSAIEEAARRDLGMVKPGETLIVIRDAVTAAPPRSTK